jgi:hypothetical protein
MRQVKKLTRKEKNAAARELAKLPRPPRAPSIVEPIFRLGEYLETSARMKWEKAQLRGANKANRKENKYKKPKMQEHQHQHGLGCRKNCRFRAGDPAASVEIEVFEREELVHQHTAECHHEEE